MTKPTFHQMAHAYFGEATTVYPGSAPVGIDELQRNVSARTRSDSFSGSAQESVAIESPIYSVASSLWAMTPESVKSGMRTMSDTVLGETNTEALIDCAYAFAGAETDQGIAAVTETLKMYYPEYSEEIDGGASVVDAAYGITKETVAFFLGSEELVKISEALSGNSISEEELSYSGFLSEPVSETSENVSGKMMSSDGQEIIEEGPSIVLESLSASYEVRESVNYGISRTKSSSSLKESSKLGSSSSIEDGVIVPLPTAKAAEPQGKGIEEFDPLIVLAVSDKKFDETDRLEVHSVTNRDEQNTLLNSMTFLMTPEIEAEVLNSESLESSGTHNLVAEFAEEALFSFLASTHLYVPGSSQNNIIDTPVFSSFSNGNSLSLETNVFQLPHQSTLVTSFQGTDTEGFSAQGLEALDGLELSSSVSPDGIFELSAISQSMLFPNIHGSGLPAMPFSVVLASRQYVSNDPFELLDERLIVLSGAFGVSLSRGALQRAADDALGQKEFEAQYYGVSTKDNANNDSQQGQGGDAEPVVFDWAQV